MRPELAFFCARATSAFFSYFTTHRPLCSAVKNLRRRKSCSHLSSVQSSGFVLVAGAFCGFTKGAFGPFIAASLPGGLVAAF
jgi:hypothetical protein